MAEIINGTDIVVKFGTKDSEIAVYCSTTCTLNINAATLGAACKDGGNWDQNLEGNKSWDVSVDGLYQIETANGFVDISDLLVDDSIPNDVSVVIGKEIVPAPATGEWTGYWTGQAVCTTTSLTGPDGELATWTAAFTGNGPLIKQLVP